MGGDMTFPDAIRWLGSFNPRPHMGGDKESMKLIELICLFQSTPPHGGRRNNV